MTTSNNKTSDENTKAQKSAIRTPQKHKATTTLRIHYLKTKRPTKNLQSTKLVTSNMP